MIQFSSLILCFFLLHLSRTLGKHRLSSVLCQKSCTLIDASLIGGQHTWYGGVARGRADVYVCGRGSPNGVIHYQFKSHF